MKYILWHINRKDEFANGELNGWEELSDSYILNDGGSLLVSSTTTGPGCIKPSISFTAGNTYTFNVNITLGEEDPSSVTLLANGFQTELYNGMNEVTFTSTQTNVGNIVITYPYLPAKFRMRSFKLSENEPAGEEITYTVNFVADYFPYGKIVREFVNSGGQERYLTTQHERDQETGLDYRGARYYDSDVARFLSLDPLAKTYLNFNPYNYVVGNPVMLIDPDGKAVKPANAGAESFVKNYFVGYSVKVGNKQINGGKLFGVYNAGSFDSEGDFKNEHQSSPIWTSSYKTEESFQSHLKDLGVTKRHENYTQIMDMWKTLSADELIEFMVVMPNQDAVITDREGDSKYSGANHYTTSNSDLDSDLKKADSDDEFMANKFEMPVYYSNNMHGKEGISENLVGVYVIYLGSNVASSGSSSDSSSSKQSDFNKIMRSIIGNSSNKVSGTP